MKRYSKGYIYSRVDFFWIRQELYGNFRYRIPFIVYTQIPAHAGHCLALFGLSGFVHWTGYGFLSQSWVLNGVYNFSIYKLVFLKRVSFWTWSLSKELIQRFAMSNLHLCYRQFLSKTSNSIMLFWKIFRFCHKIASLLLNWVAKWTIFAFNLGQWFEGAPRRHSSTKTSPEYLSHGTEGFNGVVALTIDS